MFESIIVQYVAHTKFSMGQGMNMEARINIDLSPSPHTNSDISHSNVNSANKVCFPQADCCHIYQSTQADLQNI